MSMRICSRLFDVWTPVLLNKIFVFRLALEMYIDQ
jgi:hypothetical protein